MIYSKQVSSSIVKLSYGDMEILCGYAKRLADKGFKVLGSGTHRIVIGNGSIVYKLPLNRYGIVANRDEVKCFRKRKKNKAKSRKVYFGHIPVIAMEYLSEVDASDYYDSCPWIYSLPDGGQVGMNKKGHILAFDYTEIAFKYYDFDTYEVNGELEREILDVVPLITDRQIFLNTMQSGTPLKEIFENGV